MADAPKQMSIPMAIIIAGALIAAAVYLSKVSPVASPANLAANTQVTTTPGPMPTHFDIKAVSSSDHIRGDANAPITLVEYSDLECPYCKMAEPTIAKLLSDYSGKVRLVYRHGFIHNQGPAEANAVECANDQGKFWELVDTIFTATNSNDSLDLTKLPDYAQQAGVADINKFNTCVKTTEHASITNADNNEFVSLSKAMDATGNPIGTPFFIAIGKDGKEIPIIGAQPYSEFQKVIDSLL